MLFLLTSASFDHLMLQACGSMSMAHDSALCWVRNKQLVQWADGRMKQRTLIGFAWFPQTKALCEVPRHGLQLLPYYARITATLSHIFPEIGQGKQLLHI